MSQLTSGQLARAEPPMSDSASGLPRGIVYDPPRASLLLIGSGTPVVASGNRYADGTVNATSVSHGSTLGKRQGS
jgi:hypothetical protein